MHDFRLVSALILAVSISTAAQATIVHFDFSGGGSNSSIGGSLDFSAGGLDLRVKARAHDDNGIFEDAIVTHGNNGLGVKTVTGAETTNELDSLEGNERLRFSINGVPGGIGSVSLVAMYFSNAFKVSDYDFRLNINGNNLGVFEPDNNPWDLLTEPGLDPADLFMGTDGFFFITVDEDFNPFAEFRIVGLDFRLNASEPTALLLTLLSLLMLLYGGRTKASY